MDYEQFSRDLAEYAKLDFILKALLRAEPKYAGLTMEHAICRPAIPDDAYRLSAAIEANKLGVRHLLHV